jgi:hypothetical protein
MAYDRYCSVCGKGPEEAATILSHINASKTTTSTHKNAVVTSRAPNAGVSQSGNGNRQPSTSPSYGGGYDPSRIGTGGMYGGSTSTPTSRPPLTTAASVSDGSYERAEENRFRTLSQTQQRTTKGGSTGGDGGGGGSSTPSVDYPYNVALKSGISHGEMNEFLKKTLRDYNQKNGTSFWVTPNGMRVNGTGAYMSPDQTKAFNSTIPVHAVDYKYGKAIDKALGGDATDIKNLDRFFFGKERPAGGYSKEYLTKEKEARGMGITVAELDKRNAAKAAAAAKPKEAVPVATTSTGESSEESDSQAAKKPEPKKEDKQSDKVFDKGGLGPNLPNGESLPNTAISKDDNKDKDDKKVYSAAQAEADEKQQQALAVATANKQSAKEARLKKIMEMRKPYMGGAASVSSSSDAMVVPLITPASQVPPPPLP